MLGRGADILSIAVGVIIGGAVLGLAGKGANFVPALDAWLFPVIQVDDVTDIYRDAEKACFTLRLTKLRAAVPVTYQWHAETNLSPPIGVAVYLVNDSNRRLVTQHLETHAVGTSWARRYCFELPGTLADGDALTMDGKAFHRRNPLWETETIMPTFTIGPLKGL